MPPAGFEPAIPVSGQPKTHVLDRATTGIGRLHIPALLIMVYLTTLSVAQAHISECLHPLPPSRNNPYWARASSYSRIHDHTQPHHNRLDSSGRVIRTSQILLPDNTQYSQERVILAPAGFRTRNPSKRAAADPHLKGAIHSQLN
jgi:hypothetical protein